MSPEASPETAAQTARPSLEEKRALLARMLEKRAARPRSFPLSFTQQRLWFLDRIEPGNLAYNISTAVPCHGRIDPGLLVSALQEIVRRHQTLRTTFALVDGQPVQGVAPEGAVAWGTTFTFGVIDLRGFPLERRLREQRVLTQAFLGVPFDLARPPLLRATLVRTTDREATLGLVMHHIISDGWSVGVFLQELWALYDALAAGQPSPLAELPIQYADFAAWQRQWLQGAAWEKLLGYWQARLAGASLVLDLPADRPRPAVQSYRGAGLHMTFPDGIAERLQALCRREGVTPFMLLLAAFQGLLHRYSGQEGFCVGVPVAGRNRREVEGLIGFFANTIVLRADLAGDPPFRELLGRTRESALGAFAHQDMPFEKLVEALQPERDTSRTPVFQVSFVLQNTPTLTEEQRALAMGPFGAQRDTAKFDLSIEIADTPQGLQGVLEYNRDLYDAATMARLHEHYSGFLEAALADPDARISEVAYLSAEQRRQLLVEWGTAAAGTPSPTLPRFAGEGATATLHGMFARQIQARPEATALTLPGGESLTYAELDARANRLARHLRRLGVGPESRVALCLERSAEMVVAILAALKAGGAYLPVDPTYPGDRKAWLLADSGAAVLVSRSELSGESAGDWAGGTPAVLLDDPAISAAIEEEDAASLPDLAGPDNLAYVIYTSGSTGRPKGVLIPHGNAVRLFTATDGWFGFGPEDVWTLFHSYAFDFSVWEIWGALLYGGRLVIVPYEVSRSPAAFLGLLRDEGVTVLNQTPSAFRQLLQADASEGMPGKALAGGSSPLGGGGLDQGGGQEGGGSGGQRGRQSVSLEEAAPLLTSPLSQPPPAQGGGTHPPRLTQGAPGDQLALRFVVFGGEALELAALAPWFARHGDRRPVLVNMYGITETTVHVTWRPLSLADLRRPHRSPIGVPIPDLGVHVLDRNLEPVPPGVAGEMLVGGAGLARGYLGRPELTAERFVPDPFSESPGARLYRSGDLARRRLASDGYELEYLGRLDHQVKVRGFRIELGEIEAAIAGHPGVRQAVVLVDGEGERRRLLAFVVAAGAAPDPADLRLHLAGRLPEYMIPAGWVFIPALPLTANGKTDRKALLRSAQSAVSAASAGYVAPRSELERGIAEVWQEVLGVPKVGLQDNFFDLGGHSLLLVQVQARLQERLGRAVTMTDLLSHASVDALARFLAGDPTGQETEAENATAGQRAEVSKGRLQQLRRRSTGTDGSPHE